MTSTNTLAPKAGTVMVLQLHHDDVIHIQPHMVFRGTPDEMPAGRRDADVQVDCLIEVGTVFVICWRACACPEVCGAVVYDADDYVERLQVAA